jgi:hypothetical protein
MRGRAQRNLGMLLAIGAIASCTLIPTAAAAPRQGAPAERSGKRADRYQAANLETSEPIAVTQGPPPAQTGLNARVGSLPFTGWDLIILGGVTLVLSGTGVLLRRLSVPRAPLV